MISLLSQESSPVPQYESMKSLALSLLYGPAVISVHDYWKNIPLTRWTFVRQVISLLFKTLPRFVKAFLPRRKCFFNFKSSVTVCTDFGAQENKTVTVFTFSPSICHEIMGLYAMILVFWMLNFKPAFSLSSFTLYQEVPNFLFAFCRKSGIICKYEVVDVPPSNLDFSLWVIHPRISHDVLCI